LGLAGSSGTGHRHALLEVADAGEVLVEAVAVARAEVALQIFRLSGHGVEDAPAGFEFADLGLGLGFRALEEHARENVGGFFLAGNHHAGTGPRQAADALLDVHAERERRKAREVPDAFADVLIERDGVLEARAAGMRRGGEEAIIRRMPAIHVRMRHAAEDGEVVAVRGEMFKIRREGVVAPGARGEELVGQQTEVVADAEHAARLAAGRGGSAGDLAHGGERGRHGVEQGEREEDARAAQEFAPVKGAPGGNVWSVHRHSCLLLKSRRPVEAVY
jgi:hypothetical protein